MAGYPKAFRPVTDEMRRQVLEDLPELDDLKDRALRNAAIEAWALSIAGSSFKRISEIPGDGNPGVMVLKRGTQDIHLRGVAKLAVDIVDHFAEVFPEADHRPGHRALRRALPRHRQGVGVRPGEPEALASRPDGGRADRRCGIRSTAPTSA